MVEPIRDRLPIDGQLYSTLDLVESCLVWHTLYEQDSVDNNILRLGWHENKEDAELYWNAVLKPYLANYKT